VFQKRESDIVPVRFLDLNFNFNYGQKKVDSVTYYAMMSTVSSLKVCPASASHFDFV